MIPPRIEYAPGCTELERLLASIDRHGEFCTHGQCFAAMPVLEVEDVGKIPFPVSDRLVKSLIGAAERSPYGKGSETLVDESVRNSWQIDAGCIRLGGKGWATTIANILESVTEGLGCPAGSLEASLYKMLIYEPGGFFAPHRDTEKADGMVATLTVSLPTTSFGTGGRLIVRHTGQVTSVDMVTSEPSELVYAAFYADCVHEVEKLESGYRLALVFNLRLHPDAADTPRIAPDYTSHPAPVARELTRWQNSDGRAHKLVWVMEHDYTQAGLSFDALKNTDEQIGRVLVAAAEQADFELFAALVSIEETGDAGWEYDDVVFNFDEIIDRHHSLDNWMNPQGNGPAFGFMPMRDHEMLPTGVLDDAVPDDEWKNEPTGNEGVTIERVYHRAAFVMWPRLETPTVLAVRSIDVALTWVRQRWEDGDIQTNAYVESLINAWSSLPKMMQNWQRKAGMFQLLWDVRDPCLVKRFLQDVVLKNIGDEDSTGLAGTQGWLSPDFLDGLLAEMVDKSITRQPNDIIWVLLLTGGLPEVRWDSIRRAAKRTLEALPKLLTPDPARLRYRMPGGESNTDLAAQGLCNLVIIACKCGLGQELASTVSAMADQNVPEFAERRIPEALVKLQDCDVFSDSKIYALLWHLATHALLGRSNSQPEKPDHWIIESPKSCDCELCEELKEFCRDPEATVLRISVRKDLRRHLHRVIDSNRLAMSHETERRGSPHTLVCTKNLSDHHRRLEEYRIDVSHMEALLNLADNKIDNPDRIERLHKAIAIAKR